MQSIVFLGSKPLGYHCLQYILEQQARLNVRVIGVGTNQQAVLNTTDQNISNIEMIESAPEIQKPLIHRIHSPVTF